MKIKKVFGILSLLCSMPLAFSANSFTNVVCAADAETATLDLIIQDPSDTSYYIPNTDLIDCVDANDDGNAPSSSRATLIKLYGGDYIQTKVPVSVLGGTTVSFSVRVNPVGASNASSAYNRLYFSVFKDGKLVGSESYKSLSKKTGFQIMTFETNIADTGDYTFRIASASTSTSSKYNKIYQTSITYTPYVAAPEEPDLPGEGTLSQMAFAYSKDDNGDYNIGDVVLRYGATLPYADWESLNVQAYGVALTKTSNLNGGTLSDLLKDSDLSDSSVLSGFDKVSFATGNLDNVTRVNADGDLFVEAEDGEFVLFNARLVVPSTNYDTEINAVAYVVVNNKTVLFEEVVADSVQKQANYYLDNGSYSGDVYNVLNILAK